MNLVRVKVCLDREKNYLPGAEKNIYAYCVGQKPNTRRDGGQCLVPSAQNRGKATICTH